MVFLFLRDHFKSVAYVSVFKIMFYICCDLFIYFGCPRQEGKYGSFPGGSEVKASACNAGDLGLIPGLGRSPGEGNGNPLQYSCLENPMDGGD